MNSIIVLATILAVALAIPSDTYNEKYDDFDADELVGNNRLLLSYVNCFLDKGPCTPEGSDFKKTIPEAIRTKCAKCSPKQQELVRKVCQAIIARFPEKWEELTKKEDPKGEYKQAFQEFLDASN